MTTLGLVKSYHRSHCSYICYIWEPYKGWFILGKQLGSFLVEPWNDEGLNCQKYFTAGGISTQSD